MNSAPGTLEPPLDTLIHLSFDLMVGLGMFLFVLAAWQGWWWWFHRRVLLTAWFLVPAALGGVAAVAAMEAGLGLSPRSAVSRGSSTTCSSSAPPSPRRAGSPSRWR